MNGYPLPYAAGLEGAKYSPDSQLPFASGKSQPSSASSAEDFRPPVPVTSIGHQNQTPFGPAYSYDTSATSSDTSLSLPEGSYNAHQLQAYSLPYGAYQGLYPSPCALTPHYAGMGSMYPQVYGYPGWRGYTDYFGGSIKKAGRSTYSRQQTTLLEAAYTQKPYIQKGERMELARQVGLDDKQVKIWFQNRRMKAKKEKKNKEEHEKMASRNESKRVEETPIPADPPPNHLHAPVQQPLPARYPPNHQFSNIGSHFTGSIKFEHRSF